MGKRKLRTGDRESWAGGYRRFVEDQQGGSWTYYLAYNGGAGNRVEKSTGIREPLGFVAVAGQPTPLDRAKAEFARWQANPAAYDPRDRLAGERQPLLFWEPLIERYCSFLGAPQSVGGKANSYQHICRNRALLGWWLEKLGDGRNMRAVTRDEIEAICPMGQPIPQHRFKRSVIKSFVNWLRSLPEAEGLKQGEGPDLSKFKVPQTKGLKLHGQGLDPEAIDLREHKGANAAKGWKVVREKLPEHWRNVLDVLAGTGWHVSEFSRWVSSGYGVDPMPVGREQEGAAVLRTIHKSGQMHRTIITAECLTAALAFKEWNQTQVGQETQGSKREIVRDEYGNPKRDANGKGLYEWKPCKRTRSAFPYESFIRKVRAVVKATPDAPKSFGAGHLRHAIATLAAPQAGIAGVGAFLGHKPGSKVTGQHYVDPEGQAHKPMAKVIELPRKVATLV